MPSFPGVFLIAEFGSSWCGSASFVFLKRVKNFFIFMFARLKPIWVFLAYLVLEVVLFDVLIFLLRRWRICLAQLYVCNYFVGWLLNGFFQCLILGGAPALIRLWNCTWWFADNRLNDQLWQALHLFSLYHLKAIFQLNIHLIEFFFVSDLLLVQFNNCLLEG